MPDPKASSTGYIFYKSLVNAWGEKKTLDYFDKLTDNILQYTESGSGPLNAVAEGKAAIGLGTTATAVAKINEGSPLKIVFFEGRRALRRIWTGHHKGQGRTQGRAGMFSIFLSTPSIMKTASATCPRPFIKTRPSR
jgi:iron(III) transport system substrate-binding protein